MSTKQSRIILPTIALALMTVISAVAGLNVALPSMAVDIGATQTELTWIVDSYTVVFAGLLLIAGAIGDKYGRQRILLVGLVIFAAAAAFGFFQTDPESLIIARVLMGVGAAAIMPSTLSVITASFPPEQRGKAVGVWVGVAGGGAVIGIFGSAILLEFFDWNSFFALNIVLGILAIIGTTRIPNSRDDNAHRLDWAGGLLSVVAVAGLVFAIIEGAEVGWVETETLIAFGVGFLALIGFVVREFTAQHPLPGPKIVQASWLLYGFAVCDPAVLWSVRIHLRWNAVPAVRGRLQPSRSCRSPTLVAAGCASRFKNCRSAFTKDPTKDSGLNWAWSVLGGSVYFLQPSS